MECREVGVTLRSILRCDLQAPRQRGRGSEELLVEPVAPPTDGLGERNARCNGVGNRGKRHTESACANPRTEATECDRAPDTQAAIPNPQRADDPRSARREVDLPVGEYVVEPPADDAEGHRPQRDVADDARAATARDIAPRSDDDRDDDAEDDQQRVGAKRYRPKAPHALTRAGDGREEVHGVTADGPTGLPLPPRSASRAWPGPPTARRRSGCR